MKILSTTREELLNNSINIVYISFPIVLIFSSLIYLMIKTGWSIGQNLTTTIKKNLKISLLFCILFIQFIIVTFVITINYLGSYHNLSKTISLLLFFTIFLSLIILLVTLNTIKQTKNEAVQMTQQFYIEDVDKMFTSIRGQRHDFLNHVQVVSGLVKLQKYDELKKYTKDLVGGISEVNDILEIGHPALAALIQSKTIISLDKKINFHYQFKNLNYLSLGVTSIDIVKIIGNLIDNAMQEVEHLSPENRWIQTSGKIENNNLYISCKNPYMKTKNLIKSQIFKPGFSTKNKSMHEGLGLSIIKERVDYYKGSIKVNTTENQEIEFNIKLPVKSVVL
ncbi:GHKL domain-containing protein [Chengkuizengella sp. SCS-71B]|uniref:GHKL domain-containing protein n=1 Tax=Chengkuizengella sp. SCS-71B TaxID=3115290 RepID=UPI0032C21B79